MHLKPARISAPPRLPSEPAISKAQASTLVLKRKKLCSKCQAGSSPSLITLRWICAFVAWVVFVKLLTVTLFSQCFTCSSLWQVAGCRQFGNKSPGSLLRNECGWKDEVEFPTVNDELKGFYLPTGIQNKCCETQRPRNPASLCSQHKRHRDLGPSA